MPVRVIAVDHPEVAPFQTGDRIRHEVAYFALANTDERIPVKLGESEHWILLQESKLLYDDGVIRLVSPLDSGSTAELELTEEQERLLEWLIDNEIQHIRLESHS